MNRMLCHTNMKEGGQRKMKKIMSRRLTEGEKVVSLIGYWESGCMSTIKKNSLQHRECTERTMGFDLESGNEDESA